MIELEADSDNEGASLFDDTLEQCTTLCKNNIAFAFLTEDGQRAVECRRSYKTPLMAALSIHVATCDMDIQLVEEISKLIAVARVEDAYVPNFVVTANEEDDYQTRWNWLVETCGSGRCFADTPYFAALMYKDGKIHTWCTSRHAHLRCLKAMFDMWGKRGTYFNVNLYQAELGCRAEDEDTALILFSQASAL
jgi:hypothetical protein